MYAHTTRTPHTHTQANDAAVKSVVQQLAAPDAGLKQGSILIDHSTGERVLAAYTILYSYTMKASRPRSALNVNI